MKVIKHLYLGMLWGLSTLSYGQTTPKDSIALDSKQSLPLFSLEYRIISDSNCCTYTPPPCPFTLHKAEEAIAKDSLVMVLFESMMHTGPEPQFDENQVTAFESTYGVSLFSMGCVRLWDSADEDLYGYNELIMDHLIGKYGEAVKQDYKALYR